ncbi:hypothetical protein D3C80_1544590 [compost metagenome]
MIIAAPCVVNAYVYGYPCWCQIKTILLPSLLKIYNPIAANSAIKKLDLLLWVFTPELCCYKLCIA